MLSPLGSPGAVSPATASEVLAAAYRGSGHVFWPGDVSLLEPARVHVGKLHGHRQVSDAYLLALAVHHGGPLVTNDRRIARLAVPGATQEHLAVLW